MSTGASAKRRPAAAATATKKGVAGKATVALLMVVGLAGIGATPAPAQPEALCIPLLMNCSTPSPSPSSSSGGGLGGLVGGLLGGGATLPGATSAIPDPLADPNAPTMTQPSAQLSGSSISFSGLQSVSVVTVGLKDGTRIPVIKLQADKIVIQGLVLDVRRATGPSLVTTATTMTLTGHVNVYVNSVTATTLGGLGISLLAPTPPPGNELPAQLLGIHLGLVGTTADLITYKASYQQIHE